MLTEPDAQQTVGVVERHLYLCDEPAVNVLLSLCWKPDLRSDISHVGRAGPCAESWPRHEMKTIAAGWPMVLDPDGKL